MTEDKKLPVLYVPVGYDLPNDPIVVHHATEEDRSVAEQFHDGICHWTVEPYIPFTRLWKVMEEYGYGPVDRDALLDIIDDVERDGQAK